jgi:thiol:disulfide interchange protein DsbC
MKKLTELSPEITPEQVAASPIEGLYEVTLGAYVVYMSEDGQHMLRGDLIETASGRNVTEERRFSARQAVIRDVDEDSMIVFAPEQVKHTVTVFTDVDCGYCAKLHSEMKQYTDLGISVRYLAFPRAGIDSESYDKTVSVWCADDPHEAITVAKRGESVAPKQCDNPVSSHYDLGREMGVRGTPTIVLESGEIIPGYVPADRLLAELSKPGG